MIEELLKKKQELLKELSLIDSQINDYSDGFFYIVILRRFGNTTETTHTNQHSVQEICSDYNGENGIVDVYTNNREINLTTCGDIFFIGSVSEFAYNKYNKDWEPEFLY